MMTSASPLPSVVIPGTPREFGVIFAVNGVFDIEAELPRLPARTLAMAIRHALQYEESFPFRATAHVIDLKTGREVVFDRNVWSTIKPNATRRIDR